MMLNFFVARACPVISAFCDDRMHVLLPRSAEIIKHNPPKFVRESLWILSRRRECQRFFKSAKGNKWGRCQWWYVRIWSASLGDRRQMRRQRSRLIGRITEFVVSFSLTPKLTGSVRRIVYATRCTAAHLTTRCRHRDGKRLHRW